MKKPDLSPSEIHLVAQGLIVEIAGSLAACEIPQPYKYELDTDEATIELRQALEKYITRMQDEREPYSRKGEISTVMSALAQRKRPGAKGLVRNPNGRRAARSS